MALTHWRLMEIGARCTQQYLHRGAKDVKIEFDQRLPDKRTGQLRQVDVVIKYSLGGEQILRTVEVRDQGDKVDQPYVESLQSKADGIGAHHTTVVTTRDFTKGARALIESDYRLSGARFVRARDHELPRFAEQMRTVHLVDDARGEPAGTMRLEAWLWSPLADETKLIVLLGTPNVAGLEGAIVHIMPKTAEATDEAVTVASYALTDGPGTRQFSSWRMEGTQGPEDTPFAIEARRMRRPP